MEIRLTIDKCAVFDEVGLTTNYAGVKMEGADRESQERVSVAEQDSVLLERFWAEACGACTYALKAFVLNVEHGGDAYVRTMEMPAAFDDALTDSMERSLFGCFVALIVAKWFALTNKADAAYYFDAAAAMLGEVLHMAWFKQRPKRPAPK
jgi:hypothetical protein